MLARGLFIEGKSAPAHEAHMLGGQQLFKQCQAGLKVRLGISFHIPTSLGFKLDMRVSQHKRPFGALDVHRLGLRGGPDTDVRKGRP